MNLILIIPLYFKWHYSEAIRDLLSNEKRLLFFLTRYFSISTLLSTLFAPWERMDEHYQKGLNPSAWIQTFILNTILRIFGFIVRFVTLIFSIAGLILALILGIAFIFIWIAMPILIVPLLSLGLSKII